jgi:hypothetical protein
MHVLLPSAEWLGVSVVIAVQACGGIRKLPKTAPSSDCQLLLGFSGQGSGKTLSGEGPLHVGEEQRLIARKSLLEAGVLRISLITYA